MGGWFSMLTASVLAHRGGFLFFLWLLWLGSLSLFSLFDKILISEDILADILGHGDATLDVVKLILSWSCGHDGTPKSSIVFLHSVLQRKAKQTHPNKSEMVC